MVEALRLGVGRRFALLAVVFAVACIATAPPAASEVADATCALPTAITVLSGTILYYVDEQDDGTWFYKEDTGDHTNNLQRGGTWLGFDPPCAVSGDHDMILAFVPIV